MSWLEMTASDELVESTLPIGLSMRPLRGVVDGAEDTTAVRSLHDEIARPHRWPSLRWTDDQWAAQLNTDGIRWFVLELDGATAGLAAMESSGQDVEITIFGLLPSHQGRGLGGPALTLVIREAWRPAVGTEPVRRVWLHTSTRDGANALPNDLNRGFTVRRTEVHTEELPDR